MKESVHCPKSPNAYVTVLEVSAVILEKNKTIKKQGMHE
jgi:hypothetical protein